MTGWLVTGAGGMLGQDMVQQLQREDESVTGYRRGELDITDAAAVRVALDRTRPAVVVNCAAWTAVDDVESHEKTALEGDAVAGVAEACVDLGAA